MTANTTATKVTAMTETVRVWDPLLRLFHWALVVSFAVAWLSSEESQGLHELAGYVVIGLLAFRLAWGVVGGRYARFSQFLRGPAATLAYLRDMLTRREKRYIGHNPAGAAMIVALVLSLSATAFTGWLMADETRISLLPQVVSVAHADEYGEYGDYGDFAGGEVGDLHEAFATLTLVLVALHIGGVVLASVRHKENLARAMVTGRKRSAGPGDIA